MSLEYLRKLHAGFSIAIATTEIIPCEASADAKDIDSRYPKNVLDEGFPNPWHVGTLGANGYPEPNYIIQSELEMLVFAFSLVVQLKPLLVFESGTNVGLLARAMGAGCWVNGFGTVVTCETDKRYSDYATNICSGLPIKVLNCPALDRPELSEADLVYVDSSYESRVQEILRVKSGATYVLHDTYAERWLRACTKDESSIIHFDGPRGYTMVRKV